jgi:aspartate kinase
VFKLKIVVQKYGGTSLATQESRARVCEIISQTLAEGYKAAVVVSAIGRAGDPYATDTLINLMRAVNPQPDPRELDLVISCGELISGIILSSQLNAMGIRARFLSGAEAGLVTDGNYGNAHILYVHPKNVLECLEEEIVPVIAGFQGLSQEGGLTTLGRGGSDTTASALGVALNADFIDIFTDVDGIMTADPRIVSNARLLSAITYNEICQLARDGAKVIHPRAVEIAMQRGIPLRVRSTFSDSTGTLVSHQTMFYQEDVSIIRDALITGVTYTSNIAQIRIDNFDLRQETDLPLRVFKTLADASISVDFISVQPESIMFTVAAENALQAKQALLEVGFKPGMDVNCAKVAIVGAAMTGIPGVMARTVEALAEYQIPILQSGDSYTNIWCLVKREHMEQAVRALHDKFELGKNI